ncbi:hypothetical protein OSSY52_02260 [Tepiditoga spiralis]|uniref:Fibronectin type-III domain-containing protein n=1 Tax=Tepiditoga spiralis TaxID=2108365 RepID=A0A7G1G2K2_9BACT|nr:fibronectin type III domain-containing protein [Tepiditoga spiralis]BBE30085.1 hypothetical protein OSSY52_02260 [Tepiditoga spiralis]
MKKFFTVVVLFLVFLFASCTKFNEVKSSKEFLMTRSISQKVLFDNAHSQTAGNADWTIRGGYSTLADDIKLLGYTVEEWGNDESGSGQIDDDAKITYDVLKNYFAYIIPEPNIPFTKAEQDAIIQYINDGGNVFFISDHEGADRNADGWDAVEIFNGFKKGTHTIDSKNSYTDDFVGRLGFRYEENNVYQAPVTDIRTHSITTNVSQVAVWNGSTHYMISNTINGVVYTSTTSAGPYIIAGTYGKGKFVSCGDSSMFNDGTRGDGTTDKYSGYFEYDNRTFASNVIRWFNQNSSSEGINAPNNLTVSSINTNSAKLMWSDNSQSELGYRIYLSTDNVNFIKTVELGENATSYTLNNLNSNTTYYIKVSVYYGNNEKESSIISFTTLQPFTNKKLYLTEVVDAYDYNYEYIEFYNNTSESINLNGCKLVLDRKRTDGTLYTPIEISLSGILKSKGFLIVARNSSKKNFQNYFGVRLSKNTIFINSNNKMYINKSEQRFVIKDSNGSIIDDNKTSKFLTNVLNNIKVRNDFINYGFEDINIVDEWTDYYDTSAGYLTQEQLNFIQ